MTTYVDTSSLIKLLIDEAGTQAARRLWAEANGRASAAIVRVEARAALAAALRNDRMTPGQHEEMKAELAGLLDQMWLVSVTDDVILSAAELAETEALRGYDAVHLAVALEVGATSLTSSDDALCDSATRRGLHVLNPLDADADADADDTDDDG